MDGNLYGFEDAFALMGWMSGFSDSFSQIALALRGQVITVAQNVTEMIAKIMPVALPVMGIVIAVFFGVKFIKKVMR